jgi:hypothetical protein
MDKDHIEYWPAYLQSVFAAVGRVLGDRRLKPEIACTIPAARGAIVAAHKVDLAYRPGKRGGPRSGHYVVTITGGQINACWRFRSVELETLARRIDRAVGRRAPVAEGGQELGAEVW